LTFRASSKFENLQEQVTSESRAVTEAKTREILAKQSQTQANSNTVDHTVASSSTHSVVIGGGKSPREEKNAQGMSLVVYSN
jgi:hypothetical protein